MPLTRLTDPSGLGGELFFAQISDSHIGFAKEANPDVTATLKEAVDRLNHLSRRPAFVLHTGDISQLSRPSEFDTADQVLRGIRTDRGGVGPGGPGGVGGKRRGGSPSIATAGSRGATAGTASITAGCTSWGW